MIIETRNRIINSIFFEINDIREKNDDEITNLKMFKTFIKKTI